MLPKQSIMVCRVSGKSAVAGLAGVLLILPLAACGPSYSPDVYSSNAVQQANKVDQGIVVGIRAVSISADSTVGTATGAAAGGIAGAQVGPGTVGALGALGGTVAGGLVGNVVGHSTGDTAGYEYIVRKPNGDLLSVTQKDTTALKIGQHVLIIAGPQARIVPDYTVTVDDPGHPHAAAPKPPEAAPPHADAAAPATASAATPASAPAPAASTAVSGTATAPSASGSAPAADPPPPGATHPAEEGGKATPDHPTPSPGS